MVTDDGNPVASSSESISITVTDSNRAPVLSPIGNQTVEEGNTLTFTPSATDPDGDTLTYSANNLPDGASFDPTTATFSWTPTYAQAGNYVDVEFTVMDNGTPMELAVELITITVGNVNRAPVFEEITSKELLEDELLTFTVHALDPDGDSVELSATDLPVGASFNPLTGEFTWTPVDGQDGSYVLGFSAVDNGVPIATGQIQVSITVGNNYSPEEKSENLVNDIIGYNFPNEIENAYLANLKKVAVFIETGKIEPARNQLNAFIVKVEEDYADGLISLEIRNSLVSQAEDILADLD